MNVNSAHIHAESEELMAMMQDAPAASATTQAAVPAPRLRERSNHELRLLDSHAARLSRMAPRTMTAVTAELEFRNAMEAQEELFRDDFRSASPKYFFARLRSFGESNQVYMLLAAMNSAGRYTLRQAIFLAQACQDACIDLRLANILEEFSNHFGRMPDAQRLHTLLQRIERHRDFDARYGDWDASEQFL